MGSKMRFTTKPGEFLTVIGSLPTRWAMSIMAAWVASLVCKPRITSTRAIRGGGLKKCMPIKRAGLESRAASLVIDSEEVLVAMMVSLLTISSTCLRIFSLIAWFSVAASITKPKPLRSVYEVLPLMRLSAAAFASTVSVSFLTSRSKLLLICSSPRCTAASLISTITTSRPATAHTCAIPLPIVPAPMTPTDWMLILFPLLILGRTK